MKLVTYSLPALRGLGRTDYRLQHATAEDPAVLWRLLGRQAGTVAGSLVAFPARQA
jgi:hypothetical protein